MYQIEKLPAIRQRPTLAVVVPSLPGWVSAALGRMANRNKARRDMRRLIERPYLARDVGLDTDRLRRELTRLGGRI